MCGFSLVSTPDNTSHLFPGKLSKLTRIGSGQKRETFKTDKQNDFKHFGNINCVTVTMKIQLFIKSWTTHRTYFPGQPMPALDLLKGIKDHCAPRYIF
jgi:hypothetical protein